VLLIAPLAGVQLALRSDRWIAAGVWLVSAAAFAVLLISGAAFGPPNLPIEFPPHPTRDLLWLTPICAFGFLLCPYLDLTFHRARQALSSAAAAAAFSLGFGIFFLIMILFTLAYAGLLAGATADVPVNGPEWVLQAIGAHIALQLIFTVAVHTRGVLAAVSQRNIAWSLLAASVVIGVLLALSRYSQWIVQPPLLPERIYRGFLGFYGLVFPAYVWLCMIPSPAGARRRWSVFAAAVVLAAPLFWMGFIQQPMICLLPGLALVLAARLLLRSSQPRP
jgi:hypothetical protein